MPAGKIQTSSVSGSRSFARQITAPVPTFLLLLALKQRNDLIIDFVGSLLIFT